MIRCPSCGTLNQDSRRTCSQCGTTLPQTKIRCPQCGALNPVGNLFCDRCNARLISNTEIPADTRESADEASASASLKGISLPSRTAGAPDDDADADLPDWLLGLSGEEDGTFETEDIEENDVASAGYPDWLVGLVDEDADFGGEVLPDADTDAAASELDFEVDGLPDWLLGDGPETTDAVVEEVPAEGLPDWLFVETGETGTPVETQPEDDQHLPDATSRAVDDSLSADLPDWLMGVTAGSEDDASDAEAQEAQAPETSETVSGGSFGWFSDAGTTEDGTAEDDSDALMFSESDLPEWLSEARTLGRQSASPVIPVPDEGWDDDSAETPVTAEADDSMDLPDWLSGMGMAQADADSAPSLQDDAVEGELPEWLTTLADASEADAEDWGDVSAVGTEDLTGEADVSDGGLEASELEEDVSLEEQALPDWLTDTDTPASAVPSAIFTEDAPAPADDFATSEPPSWLQELTPAAAAPDPASAVPAFTDTDEVSAQALEGPELEEEASVHTPDWLEHLDLKSAGEDVPAVSGIDGEGLARADLPAWLQDLRPPEVQEAAPGRAVPGRGAADGSALVPADIPDWVQALRPEPGEAGAKAHERDVWLTPAELEGPLSGLPGVIAALTSVDVPSKVKRNGHAEIPEPVRSQAQLWQQLLEQPRSAARPVSRPLRSTRATDSVLRGLIFLVLCVSILATFLILPEDLQLTQVSPSLAAPGVPALMQGLEALSPGAHVVLAIEYTPAYAEEMAHIALPLLEHLDARQVKVTLVSTLPEGVGLGAVLTSQAGYQSGVVEGGYLLGNANGVAAFLQGSGAAPADCLVVLTSQSERLRWWVEQNAAREGQVAPLPLSAGLSASAGPLVVPYLEAQQVQGWIVGLPDALAYRELRGETMAGPYGRLLDALMLGHGFIAGLLFLGLCYGLIAGKKGAR